METVKVKGKMGAFKNMSTIPKGSWSKIPVAPKESPIWYTAYTPKGETFAVKGEQDLTSTKGKGSPKDTERHRLVFPRGREGYNYCEIEVDAENRAIFLPEIDTATSEKVKGGHRITPEGKAFRIELVQLGLATEVEKSNGLSESEKTYDLEHGLVIAKSASTGKNSSKTLRDNRFAEQGGEDYFTAWKKLGVRLGNYVMTDDGIRLLKPETLHMLPDAAGGTCDDANTRAGFNLTNDWMRSYTDKGTALTDEDVNLLIENRIELNHVRKATRAEVQAHIDERNRRQALTDAKVLARHD